MRRSAGLVVLTTTPDRRSALVLARSLVVRKLAACVSLKSGFLSIYSWKGKTETSSETVLFIKTVARHFAKIKKAVRSTHPYELPEIIALPMARVSQEYWRWLTDMTK